MKGGDLRSATQRLQLGNYYSEEFMATDLNGIPDEVYESWLREAGGASDQDSPTEENLVGLFSATIREQSPQLKAQGFIDVANMALAMADKTLGSQVPVAKCLMLDLH